MPRPGWEAEAPALLVPSLQLQGASLLMASVKFRFIPACEGVETSELRSHTSGDSTPCNYFD